MNLRKPRRAYLSEPAAHIIPSDAHDVAPLERSSTSIIASSITQKPTISKAQVVDECGIADLDVERGRELGRSRRLRVCVPADEAFISFSDDPRLTSSVGACL